MKSLREDTTKTRRKLLAAAGDIFAEKGFRDATIAEICRKAGTNIAAVNYHFGSKKVLYREAWRHVYAESIQAHPTDGGVPEAATPQERLRGQVTALLLRMADRNNRAFGFLHRELGNPTGLLDEVIKEQLQTPRKKTKQLIRLLLGPLADEQEVSFCEMAIIGQCMNPMVVRGELRQNGSKDDLRRIAEIESYAQRIVVFSLAGISAIRKIAEKRKADKRKLRVPRKGNRK